MTKPVVHNDTEYDIVAEKFIPVIANRSDLENSSISRYPQYFMLVRDVEAYYYRKLFTNNLGHAVISYIGIKKGYKTTCEAMNDKYITVSYQEYSVKQPQCLKNFTTLTTTKCKPTYPRFTAVIKTRGWLTAFSGWPVIL